MPSVLTSESVSEGHPDKVCDYIADCVLDAHLAEDPGSRVACEVLCKGCHVVLAGEITSRGRIDLEAVVRAAIREVGYTDSAQEFHADGVAILSFLSSQAPEIARGVNAAADAAAELGAGDQGIMFGYATNETRELMPLPLLLAHRLTRTLADDRRSTMHPWLRPDAKARVSVEYHDGAPRSVSTVLVSTQHAPGVDQGAIRAYVADDLLPRALGEWNRPGIEVLVNPTGSFVKGGPAADCGVTGRKIIVDTYGGAARHGGAAFSGKDATKVDRTGAYYCRLVARHLVRHEFSRRAEVQVAYAIGRARPVSVLVETFGTGDGRAAAEEVRRAFDFRPAAMIERLGLRRPLFSRTTNYGHFGRPGFTWED